MATQPGHIGETAFDIWLCCLKKRYEFQVWFFAGILDHTLSASVSFFLSLPAIH